MTTLPGMKVFVANITIVHVHFAHSCWSVIESMKLLHTLSCHYPFTEVESESVRRLNMAKTQ